MEDMMKELCEDFKALKGSIADLVYIELAKMPYEIREQLMGEGKAFTLKGERPEETDGE